MDQATFDECPLQPGDRVEINAPGDEFHGDIAIVKIINLETGQVSVTMWDNSMVHGLFHIDQLNKLA
jgi:hypothetical protein